MPVRVYQSKHLNFDVYSTFYDLESFDKSKASNFIFSYFKFYLYLSILSFTARFYRLSFKTRFESGLDYDKIKKWRFLKFCTNFKR